MANNISAPVIMCVIADSVQATTGASSATVAIPNDASGTRAKFVRITSKGNAYIRPGASTATAAAATAILAIAGESLYLNVSGMTHIAHIQETSASVINISPLELA